MPPFITVIIVRIQYIHVIRTEVLFFSCGKVAKLTRGGDGMGTGRAVSNAMLSGVMSFTPWA